MSAQWLDSMPDDAECNAQPFVGSDPVADLHREEADHSMQMLAWALLSAASVACGLLVWAIKA